MKAQDLTRFGTIFSLSANWEFVSLAANKARIPTDLAALDLTWRPAIVPGTVAGSERALNSFKYGQVQYDAFDYWYRCHLTLPEEGLTHLHFEGLATLAEVYWNDEHILSSENMFAEALIDMTSQPRSGTLWIRFRSIDEFLKAKRPRPKWRTKLVDQQQIRWIRSTLLGRIPGWSPPVAPVGPWRSVNIVGLPDLIVDSFRAQSVEKPKLDDGYLVFAIELVLKHPNSKRIFPQSLVINDRDYHLALSVQSADSQIATCEVKIQRKDLWWPHTHGTPNLQHLQLRYELEGRTHTMDLGLYGFRTIQAEENDGAFSIIVNDTPIFCRGAVWTPIDPINFACDQAQIEKILVLARDAGMNMLRIVGSMIYEQQEFYRLCDLLGIMIWQDFMFSNLDYPFSDEKFARSALTEAGQFLKRTQLNPSLTILCGNSDIEQQCSMLGLPRNMWRPDFFARELPQLAQELRPELPYLPSSPSGGDLPFLVNYSVSHYYGVGAYMRPLTDARLANVRFAAECLGFANVPDGHKIQHWLGHTLLPTTHPRWKERVPRDGGVSWDFDDVRDHYLGTIFATDPMKLRAADVERYLLLSRITSGEVMARTICEWRRTGSPCRGALLWWLRDLWMGAGWGVIDADGDPKAAYYFVRRVMSPTAIFFTDEGLNGLELHVINDTAETIMGVLELHFLRDGQVSTGLHRVSVISPPHSQSKHNTATITEYFNDPSYAYRFGPPAHNVVRARWIQESSGDFISESFLFPLGLSLATEHDIGLKAHAHRLSDSTWELKIATTRFAQFIHFESVGLAFSDQYFHLYPGCDRSIIVRTQDPTLFPSGRVHALNSVLGTTIQILT